MEARLKPGLRKRHDQFGGVCYVPHRDDFFAANNDVYKVIEDISTAWQPINGHLRETIVALAKIGVCETRSPQTAEVSYSGPSFLGSFLEIPTVSDPLVLNCFCTSHCPLQCVYCHADDLMKEFRSAETDQDLENVAATASMIPAMVAVITGGDPLTKPDRAIRLIEKLSGQKALVLDTSGVGQIDALIDCLREYKVHVRISLDAISSINDRVRPINPAYTRQGETSRLGAQGTIEKCLEAGIPVTVQTVVSARNENESELRDLRDELVLWGVRNWVIHVAVKGGNARRIENEAARRKRKRGILPSPEVYTLIRKVITDTEKNQLPLDIRCTDNDNTPNSVLLVGSTGDLFTEGLAHNGKVRLFHAGEGRPDLVRSLWFYVDRFGHARRYFNWHPWQSPGASLEDLCYAVPVPSSEERTVGAVVETEAKFRVNDLGLLWKQLDSLGFVEVRRSFQRDEYYDTPDSALTKLDFVVRLRQENPSLQFALKGPRFYTKEGEYSRLEFEFEPKTEESMRQELTRRGLACSWYFEKRRTQFKSGSISVAIFIDEIPEVGHFIEMEGPPEKIQEMAVNFSSAIGEPETRNYAELYRDFKANQGVPVNEVKGAEFTGA